MARGGRTFCPYESCRRLKYRKYYKPWPECDLICTQCGVTYEGHGNSTFCSRRCMQASPRYKAQRRRENQARRARLMAAERERFDQAEVFERDGYRCGICKRLTLRTAVVPHPRAPVLDHIIPLVQDGAHTKANTQCACFLCNSIKGDRILPRGEQLRLIG